MPFDDYSRYKDEYEPEPKFRRIPPYYEEGLYQSAYEEDDYEEVVQDVTEVDDRE